MRPKGGGGEEKENKKRGKRKEIQSSQIYQEQHQATATPAD